MFHTGAGRAAAAELAMLSRDVLALAGRSRTPVLAGEATWRRSVDGARIAATLREKLSHAPGAGEDVELAICARDEVSDAPEGALTVTAEDIFGLA